jgi:predicted ester cyclase/heme-degrading monooxygenase HmoA
MKTLYLLGIIAGSAFLGSPQSIPGKKNSNPKNEKTMETVQQTVSNKEIISNLYEKVLNSRRIDLLPSIVAESYKNDKGETGREKFSIGINELLAAFADGHWEIVELVAAGDKVMVQQRFTGTHTGTIQHIAPTGKHISVNGTALYVIDKGKIVYSSVLTDRFSFLQQLGILSADPTKHPVKGQKENVFFIDKFQVPREAAQEFKRQMNYNRSFIRNLDGFINDDVYVQTDSLGNLHIITIAVWKNQECLEKAKEGVKAEYQRIEFNPIQFTKRLNISTERGVYKTEEE